MKVMKKELKGRSGEIALMADTLEDLWHLKYIIDPNDVVFSLTKRKPEGADDKIRPEKLEKVTVRLGIRVESTEFHKFANRLRIHGVIVSGMDMGMHHTLNIEEGTSLSIVKEQWKNDQLERIAEAEEAGKRPSVIIVGIEEGDADIGLVRHYGVEPYSHIRQSSGKRENGLRDVFFKEIADQLNFVYKDGAAIVLCGPGFTKDDFLLYFKKAYPELASKAVTEDSTMIGISGFLEVLKKGSIDKIMHESRLARETNYMDDFLKEVAIDGKAAYGPAEVQNAINYGAVETLLVADEKLREERETADGKTVTPIENMMQEAERSQGKVIILSTEFEPGRKLASFGGVAAILRYKMGQ
ncbi:mRNA surveillance protein pelota [Methanolapillus millepedarum]|uniref:Protein pelota homolog n=1 Tax=Methanolapillus millepedarum TaxID=3028296 RepID=A0AA96V345_9EURY|nr:hypothetical protein MsAc7_07440 [Methanosarcinaceae archaeon Ac7]